ncbi:inositol monophosphatase [Leucobacter zeae]|nr:inositol monophosphatase [Leucobacter zeae]
MRRTAGGELLEAAITAAAAGAEVLRRGFGSRLTVDGKGDDGNLVTDIDLAAERAVRSALAARRPDDAVTGEELPDDAHRRAEVRWSIDPLDGTTNYTRGIPFFATSVGAQDLATGEWIVGAVHAPLLDRVYFARRGGGAWVRGGGGTRRLNGPTGETSARLLGTGLSYDPRVRAAQYAGLSELMRAFTDARALGSAALGVCGVADGTLDGFIEDDLGEYDWAGAAVVAEEAGLVVTRPSGDRTELRVLPAALA